MRLGQMRRGCGYDGWEVGNWSGQLGVRDNVGARLNEDRVDLDASEGDSSSVSSTTATDGALNFIAKHAHAVDIVVPQARDLDAYRAAHNLW